MPSRHVLFYSLHIHHSSFCYQERSYTFPISLLRNIAVPNDIKKVHGQKPCTLLIYIDILIIS